eukprot:5700040-Pleurochrysis_carterae.AAC.2
MEKTRLLQSKSTGEATMEKESGGGGGGGCCCGDVHFCSDATSHRNVADEDRAHVLEVLKFADYSIRATA